jgi:hypothetical protein
MAAAAAPSRAAPMAETGIAPTGQDVTLARLEDQIGWYEQKSKVNQRRFKLMKGITIVSAAVIPVLSTAPIAYGRDIAGGLGILIAIVEGLQQLNQYHSNWTTYRATAESLKHEKYLFLARAGPYLGADNASAMLAERVEAQVSQENSKWFTAQSQKPGSQNSAAGSPVS